jgi:hypothetical protein
MNEQTIIIKDQLSEMIQKWAEENFVGMPVTESTMSSAEWMIRERYAEELGLPVEQVHLLNFRTEGEGIDMVWDGIDLTLPGL